jgi:hypothetical protein
MALLEMLLRQRPPNTGVDTSADDAQRYGGRPPAMDPSSAARPGEMPGHPPLRDPGGVTRPGEGSSFVEGAPGVNTGPFGTPGVTPQSMMPNQLLRLMQQLGLPVSQ